MYPTLLIGCIHRKIIFYHKWFLPTDAHVAANDAGACIVVCQEVAHTPSTASPSSLTARWHTRGMCELSRMPSSSLLSMAARPENIVATTPPRATHSMCSTLVAVRASGGTSSCVSGQGAVTLERGAAVADMYDLDLSSSGPGRGKPPQSDGLHPRPLHHQSCEI